jgi:hypothetical protein
MILENVNIVQHLFGLDIHIKAMGVYVLAVFHNDCLKLINLSIY